MTDQPSDEQDRSGADAPATDETATPVGPADPAGGAGVAPADPGAAPLPPPLDASGALAAAGWYSDPSGTRPDIVRYWDGSAWTDRWTQGEKQRARYGEKYRRRLPLTIIGVAVANALTALLRLTQPPSFPTSTGTAVGIGVGFVVGMFAGGALWNLIVAAFPGQPKDKQRKPFLRNPWVWAVVVSVVVGPIASWSLYRPAPVPEMTIASPADGCRVFMDTTVTAAKEKISDATLSTYFAAMKDAAATTDPQLAADLAPLTGSLAASDVTAATKSIMTRCLSEGYVTQEQLTTWVQQLQAASG